MTFNHSLEVHKNPEDGSFRSSILARPLDFKRKDERVMQTVLTISRRGLRTGWDGFFTHEHLSLKVPNIIFEFDVGYSTLGFTS